MYRSVSYWFYTVLLQFHAPVREWNKKDLRDILTSILRVVFWTMFIEVILHYFYFSAIMLHHRLMWHIPLWALAGIGYGAGQFFMVKVNSVTELRSLSTTVSSLHRVHRVCGLFCEVWNHEGMY